ETAEHLLRARVVLHHKYFGPASGSSVVRRRSAKCLEQLEKRRSVFPKPSPGRRLRPQWTATANYFHHFRPSRVFADKSLFSVRNATVVDVNLTDNTSAITRIINRIFQSF